MSTRDPGVQNERTALAWQRTALSVVVACVAATRLSYERVGPLALLDLLVALPLAGFVVWESGARYRRRLAGPTYSSGRAAALLVVSVLVIATVEMVAVSR